MNNLKSVVFYALVIIGCFSVLTGNAQETKTITGTVFDSKNETIIGATVAATVSGNIAAGAVTDVNGNFRLSVPVGSTLNVTYIGYKPVQETVTAEKAIYNFVLQEDVKDIDEVVVVGYGSQKRSELTGSISSVRADDVKDFSSKSLAESLTGMAAGVMVTKSEGSPGSEADIIIRGAGSLNGMSPLYIVDGVPQDACFNFNMFFFFTQKTAYDVVM